MKNILEYKHSEAKSFLLKQESFTNIDLPSYFVFAQCLSDISEKFTEELSLKDINGAKKQDTTNHILYGNKDGKYAWRKFQIINPLIYISMVNIITAEENWECLQKRFEKFSNCGNIKCESLPIEKKNEQILHWLANIEKKSISLSLEYQYLCHTDITNCYGSIYTHSLPWAIHGKYCAKDNRGYYQLFGNKLDHHLQAMSYGQTNGIPQGSVLMDLIAEIVLGYADSKLAKKLESKNCQGYYILRYRDDYRIFANNLSTVDIIFKCLGETLLELGFHLNASKTCLEQDIIGGSLKYDKYGSLKYNLVPEELCTYQDLLYQLLVVQQISKKFPNSGTLISRLSKIKKATNTDSCFDSSNGKIEEKVRPLVAILIDIGYNNPRCFSSVMQLISIYIKELQEKERKCLFGKIKQKVGTLHNIGLLEIWIQRVAIKYNLNLEYQEALCKYVRNYNQEIFNTSWMKSNAEARNIIDKSEFVDIDKINKLEPEIQDSEINPFYWS